MCLGFFVLCIVLASADSDPDTDTPTPSPTLSGCQVCAASGDSSQAYNGGLGQFCGNWLDRANERQRCCCPLGAYCRLSSYECRCSWDAPTPAPTKKPDILPLGGWLGIGAGCFALVSCFWGWGWWLHRKDKKNQSGSTGGQPGCNVVPTVYGNRHHSGEQATGYVTGMVVADAAYDSGYGGGGGYDSGGGGGGYDGGGGGYDGGGGDSGGGGGDFGGDF